MDLKGDGSIMPDLPQRAERALDRLAEAVRTILLGVVLLHILATCHVMSKAFLLDIEALCVDVEKFVKVSYCAYWNNCHPKQSSHTCSVRMK